MAIAPITVGDGTARTKINQAIAKANLVDGKVDQAAFDAGATALAAAIDAAVGGEAAARDAAIGSAVGTEASARANADATEKAEREAAVATLSGQIASLTSGKASTGALATEQTARANADNAEATARANADATEKAEREAADAALGTLVDELEEAILTASGGARPAFSGITFTDQLIGGTGGTAPGDTATNARGATRRLVGPQILCLRERLPVIAQLRWRVLAMLARAVNPSAPQKVQVGICWLDKDGAALQVVVPWPQPNDTPLAIADGVKRIEFTLGTGCDAEPPAGAVDAVIWVRTFGANGTDGTTHVDILLRRQLVLASEVQETSSSKVMTAGERDAVAAIGSTVGTAVAAETSAREAAIAAEAATREAALAAEAAARVDLYGGLVSGARSDPGLARRLFASALTGKAATLTPIAIGSVGTSDRYGTVLLVAGADIGGPFVDVVPLEDIPIRLGEVLRWRLALERVANPVDPLSDGVEVRIQNLNRNHNHVSNVRFGDAHVVTTADDPVNSVPSPTGPLEVAFTMGRSPPAGVPVDYEVPASTRYVRPHFRIYGGAPQVAAVAYIEHERIDTALAAQLAALQTVGTLGLTITPATAELGTSPTPHLAWSTPGTATVSDQAINGASIGALVREWDAPAPVTADTTYTLAVTDTLGRETVESAAIAFLRRVRWGVSAAAALDGAGVVALGPGALANSLARDFTVDAGGGAGKYVYYAFPTALGVATDFRLFGFAELGAATVTAVTVNTPAGPTPYTVIRSPFPLIGNVPVEVS